MPIIHKKFEDLEPKHHVGEHSDFEYKRYDFVPREAAKGCMVHIYEVPPSKSPYPYHYHMKNEEIFYILSGRGILKTPEGERRVSAGEMLFFPANETGAHKLTNDSKTEPLRYIDYSTTHDVDICIYPDSDKIGVWGENFGQVYKQGDKTGYYENE